MPDPMTPAEFVAEFSPHLPIGPYTKLPLGDMEAHGLDCTDAAHLLIGALVCEDGDAKKYTIDRGFVLVGVARGRALAAQSAFAESDTPIGILRALLAARSAAKKEATHA